MWLIMRTREMASLEIGGKAYAAGGGEAHLAEKRRGADHKIYPTRMDKGIRANVKKGWPRETPNGHED